MMSKILASFIDQFVLVYLDDIVIFSKTIDDQKRHVEEVLTRLATECLVLSASKCRWAEPSLVYLRHVVDGKGLRTNPAKVSKILDWPTPTTITDVWGFFNLVMYYKHFVPHFSTLMSHVGPL
ncbi:hypothetical protein JCM5296_004242 [Sporobolomyces johnsonii]